MKTKSAVLLAIDAMGVYIPQSFADAIDPTFWRYIKESDLDTLKAGPEFLSYWEAWIDVLDNAETLDGRVLWQDNDLWVIDANTARDEINSFCQDQLEYFESHKDAGDAYAHMPAESWSSAERLSLFDYVIKAGIDTHGLDLDQIADLVLDCFKMFPGNIHGACDLDDSAFILAAYPVQEVEIDLSGLGLDGITSDYVRESCDPYIKGDLAYLTSDAVWFAGITKGVLQRAINREAVNP